MHKQLLLINTIFYLFVGLMGLLIYLYIKQNMPLFPFVMANMVGILCFFSFARWVFFLKHSWLSKSIVPKLVLMILLIPIFMYLQQGLQQYLLLREKTMLQSLVDSRHAFNARDQVVRFVHTEYTFFLIAALIQVPILFVRLLISIWRNYNRASIIK